MHVNYLFKNLKIMGIWNVTRKIVFLIREKNLEIKMSKKLVLSLTHFTKQGKESKNSNHKYNLIK